MLPSTAGYAKQRSLNRLFLYRLPALVGSPITLSASSSRIRARSVPRLGGCAPYFSVSSLFNCLPGAGRVYSAFTVGVIANIYGRFFRGNAFAVMVRIYL